MKALPERYLKLLARHRAALKWTGVALAVALSIYYGIYFLSDNHKVGAWLIQCPIGHETVRVVPVLWGMRGANPEEDRKVKAREAVFGGCAMDGLSPAYYGLCQTCGAQYDPARRVWTIDSDDRQTRFPTPMQWPILEITALLHEEFGYSQEVYRGKVVRQEARIWTHLDPNKLTSVTQGIERVLKSHKIAYKKTDETHVYRVIQFYWEEAEKSTSIELRFSLPDSIYFKIDIDAADYLDSYRGSSPKGFFNELFGPGYTPVMGFKDRWNEWINTHSK